MDGNLQQQTTSARYEPSGTEQYHLVNALVAAFAQLEFEKFLRTALSFDLDQLPARDPRAEYVLAFVNAMTSAGRRRELIRKARRVNTHPRLRELKVSENEPLVAVLETALQDGLTWVDVQNCLNGTGQGLVMPPEIWSIPSEALQISQYCEQLVDWLAALPASGTPLVYPILAFTDQVVQQAPPRLRQEVQTWRHGKARSLNVADEQSANNGSSPGPAAYAALTETVLSQIETIARWLDGQSAALLLGPGAAGPPSRHVLSRQLMIDGFGLDAKEVEAVSSMDVAGMYYASLRGDDTLQEAVRKVIKNLKGAAATAQDAAMACYSVYDDVAGLLRAVQPKDNEPPKEKPRTGSKVPRWPLIVTTNLDLGLERALIANGVSFLRVVQSRTNHPLRRIEYDQIRQGDSILQAPREVTMDRYLAISEYTVTNDGFSINGTPVAGDDPGAVDESQVRWEADETIEPALRRVVLYKFHGSEEIDESCIISLEDYDRFEARLVPPCIAGYLATRPLFSLGYRCTDPEFRHVRRTLLRTRPASAGYAVQAPPQVDWPNYSIERKLQGKAADLWLKVGCVPIELECKELMRQIISALEHPR
jgi:hypothetical protein